MINFLGDVFLDKQYDIDFELKDYIFNLEYPLSCSGKPAKEKVNLCQNKSYIEETFGKFPLAVCLANNHIMDYGEEAFSKTISYLNSRNIKYFGAGNRNNNFNNPCKIIKNEKKISLFGYCCPSTNPIFGTKNNNGAAPLDIELIEKDILIQKSYSDFIIVNLHWGDEEISYPKPKDIEIARKIIDMGADMVIGHHAHVIQTIETYKGKKIFYGIGNFLFPNLYTNSMYDGIEFKNKYTKIENTKNRKSIIIEMHNTQNISYKTTYFDYSKVILKKTKIPKWLPKNSKDYKNYYKLWTRIRMLELYLKKPRIPTLKQIKLFLGLR